MLLGMRFRGRGVGGEGGDAVDIWRDGCFMLMI